MAMSEDTPNPLEEKTEALVKEARNTLEARRKARAERDRMTVKQWMWSLFKKPLISCVTVLLSGLVLTPILWLVWQYIKLFQW